MKKRRKKEADASFWMGLVLGIFIGGAAALVLTPGSGEENRAVFMDKAHETIEKAQEAKSNIENAS